MSDKNRIIIFDTTMRDGEQSPGASMSLEEKLQISRVFDELGVDVIGARARGRAASRARARARSGGCSPRAERRAATRRTRANETRGIAVDARSDAKSEKRVRDGD